VQLGSRVLMAYEHDRAIVAGKGHTCLTSAAVTGVAGVARQQGGDSVTTKHHGLLITPGCGYSGGAT
jgi:hypothetical protein